MVMMQSKFVWLAAALCVGLVPSAVFGESLSDLVKKEEGVEFGVCNLTPRPNVGGKDVYVVVPARFPNPGIWITRTLLFVGVDDGKSVTGVAEATTLHDVAPREVISVVCSKSTVMVRMTDGMKPKTLTYAWDGKGLRKAGRK